MARKKKNAWGPFGSRETYRVTRAPGRAGEHSYKGFKVWQTWPEGFKTSADPESTFDSLKDVKRFIDWQQKNPGKLGSAFKRCVKAVSEKGGAYDPQAVCAAAGRRKYGAKKYAALAKAGRNPTRRRETESEYRQRPAYRDGFEVGRNDLMAGRKGIDLRMGARELLAFIESRGFSEIPAGDRPGVARDTEVRAWEAGYTSAFYKRNPANEVAAVYEEFHGRPSTEVISVTEKIHYHKHLSALGELRKLIVQARDGSRVTLTRFKKAVLCTNEAKNQLFIRGGDQSVDLRTFGIRTEHEVETLGQVTELAYFTTKDHLGDEGGTAIYFHVTGETNENGKRKMAGWAPDLIYHTVDERLEFSGGSYTIKAEGIDK